MFFSCERAFSHLNTIKAKYRFGLSHTRLSALMHIHPSKTTTETFDPKPAADPWIDTAYQRLGQNLRGPSSSSTIQGAEAENSAGDMNEGSEEGCVIKDHVIYVMCTKHCLLELT